MKKLKLFGAAVIAASLIFSGCAPQSDDETTTPVEKPGKNNNGEDTEVGEFKIEFTDSANSSSYKNGVYTISVANANDSEWGNQIFIKNPNKDVELVAGDKIHATITLEADKEIATMFVKDQFNGVNYSGIDTQKNLPANTKTVFDIYGSVANDYDETAGFVLALRGNEAETTLKMSNIKVEKLGDYAVTKVTVSAASTSISSGETTTLKAVDQYGFEITDATFEITSENPTATISGNVLTTGDTAEEITVVAKKGEITSNPLTITITAEKDYAKYWTPEQANIGRDAAPKDYFSIWADQWWCGSGVALSNMSATEDGISLTQTVEGFNWFGTQIWYGLSTISNISFKVTSTVAGDITINTGKGNVVYTLEAGVEKEFSFEAAKDLLAIQLGKESEPASILGDCTFTISDFSVTAAE